MKLKLKEIRKAAGYRTAGDLAAASGFSERRLRAWESGEAMPSLIDAAVLCDLLDITLDELVGRVTPTQSDAVDDALAALEETIARIRLTSYAVVDFGGDGDVD